MAPRLALSPQEVLSCDLLLRGVSLQALSVGFDGELDGVERCLLYSGLLMSEKADDLHEAERRMQSAIKESPAPYRPFIRLLLERLSHHRRALDRFGRIPHLNARRGRKDTVEEAEWKIHREGQRNSARANRAAAAWATGVEGGAEEGANAVGGIAQQPALSQSSSSLREASTSSLPHSTAHSSPTPLTAALRWPRADG